MKHLLIWLLFATLFSACGGGSGGGSGTIGGTADGTTGGGTPGGGNTGGDTSGGITGGTTGGTESGSTDAPENYLIPNLTGDITAMKLANRDPDCGAYVGSYSATINDVQQGVVHNSSLNIGANATSCTFTSNNIPNHEVGVNTTTGRDFATLVGANVIDYVLIVPRNPTRTDTPTYVRKRGGFLTLNGILLNGVDLDMDSAFCYDSGANDIVLIGCGLNADWYAIPAENPSEVTLDEYTGHPFDGRYHYHSDNHGLSNVEAGDLENPPVSVVDPSGSPVIGFAPDGFPIYGHYFYDDTNGVLRKAQSSWTTHTGERETPAGSSDPFPPIALFPRGIFVEDWFYSEGSGDLDECNGMVDAYGNYGYYYTEDYPYAPLCSFGTPDGSFEQPNSAYDDGGLN